MATTGRLGAIAPAAATNKTLYKPGAGLVAAGLVLVVCNQGAVDDQIRIAIMQNASLDQAPATADFIFFDHTLKAKGDSSLADTLMVTGLCLANANNDQIVVKSANGTNTSFVVMGIEEAA